MSLLKRTLSIAAAVVLAGSKADRHRAVQSRNGRPRNSAAGLPAVPNERTEPGLPGLRGPVCRLTVPAEAEPHRRWGSAKQITNITIQDKCPADVIEHDQAPNDPVVQQWAANALAVPNGPADPAFRPSCL